MSDVTALGEILIDFTSFGISDQGIPTFEQNPGGAPANVLACLSKLGKSTSFIGKVGKDQFGIFLEKVLNETGISTKGLVKTSRAGTTLAFVHLDEKGERSFTFYRNPGADLLLETKDISTSVIDSSKIFHFGSVSLTGEPSRTATLEAAIYANNMGKIISYDPNLRLMLWESEIEAKKQILNAMKLAHIVKVSEEELFFLSGINDISLASKSLLEKYNLKLLIVTLGENGAIAYNQNAHAQMPGFEVDCVDTTGAGDAFTGAFLYKLLQSGKNPQELLVNELEEILVFSNAAGALTTTKRGAIYAMPQMDSILSLIAKE